MNDYASCRGATEASTPAIALPLETTRRGVLRLGACLLLQLHLILGRRGRAALMFVNGSLPGSSWSIGSRLGALIGQRRSSARRAEDCSALQHVGARRVAQWRVCAAPPPIFGGAPRVPERASSHATHAGHHEPSL